MLDTCLATFSQTVQSSARTARDTHDADFKATSLHLPPVNYLRRQWLARTRPKGWPAGRERRQHPAFIRRRVIGIRAAWNNTGTIQRPAILSVNGYSRSLGVPRGNVSRLEDVSAAVSCQTEPGPQFGVYG